MAKIKSNPIERSIESIIKRFPGRDDVIAGLERRLTKLNWPFLLIDGPHSTGKTCIIRALLELLESPFAWTNCIEIESLKGLQKKILYDLDTVNCPEVLNEERAQSRVASNEIFINQFVEGLERLTAKQSKIKVVRLPKTPTKTPTKASAKIPTKTPTKSATKRARSETDTPSYAVESKVHRYFIVLDNYDKLVASNINILTTLNQVHDMMKDRVRLVTIMITDLHHDQLLYSFALVPKPIVYSFPNFDPKSLPKVLSTIVTEDHDETYYKFCQIVCQTLSSSINDLKKLSYITEEAFMDHIGDLEEKGLPSDEIDKQLRKCFLEKVDDYVHRAISFSPSNQSTSSTLKELPKSTKYLLISAFIASYNSKASDKKFFVIHSDKRKVTRQASKKEQAATAPKLFPLERLLHIYSSLVYLNESENHNLKESQLNQPTNQLLSQIETLVNLKLLVKANSVTISPLSSLIKYQISDFITYEFMDSLAKSVGIQLQGHMNF